MDAGENLNFLEAIEEYNKAPKKDRPKMAKEIFDSFSETINVSSGHLTVRGWISGPWVKE